MSDNELDLFGEDPQEEQEAKEMNEKKALEAAATKKLEEEKKKAKKPVKVAKSIIVFDVKVYEQDEDLEKLAQEIKTKIIMDGLVWNKEHSILPIGYGMNKLQLTIIIEDEKVSVDDITEKIETDWEDNVQSTDIDSFNKI